MPLTAHDAEEGIRPLEGKVLDAQEKVSATYADALKSPEAAEIHLAAMSALINRQSELIAALREQVRQAIT